jgi:hypothetical protein
MATVPFDAAEFLDSPEMVRAFALEVIATTTWWDSDGGESEYEREVGDSVARDVLDRLEAAGIRLVRVDSVQS